MIVTGAFFTSRGVCAAPEVCTFTRLSAVLGKLAVCLVAVASGKRVLTCHTVAGAVDGRSHNDAVTGSRTHAGPGPHTWSGSHAGPRAHTGPRTHAGPGADAGVARPGCDGVQPEDAPARLALQ